MAIFRTLAATAVAMVVAGTAYAQTVGVGTGPVGSLTNNLATVIAYEVTQKAGLDMLVQPYDGDQQHFGLTSSGDLAFSLGNIQELWAAISGTEQFEGSGFSCAPIPISTALPNLAESAYRLATGAMRPSVVP